MSSVLSRRTKRMFHDHEFAREQYLNRIGLDVEEVRFTEDDLAHAKLRYALSMLHQKAFRQRIVFRCLVFSLISVGILAGLSMMSGLHHQFPSHVLTVLTALGIAPLVTAIVTTPAARRMMRSWEQMMDEVWSTGKRFDESVADDLDAVGVKVLKKHSLGRYMSNRGLVLLITVDGDLDVLLNGKLLQIGRQ